MKKMIGGIFLMTLGPWASAQQASPEALFKQWDKNKDGKLDKEEVPERMARMIERGDTNQDGVLDKKELETMAQRLTQRPPGGGNRPGGDGQRPGAPGGGDRPAPPNRGQDLPKRPGTN